MTLTQDELDLLRLLQNDPNITYVKIAKIFGVKPPTAKRRVQALKKKGIYRGKTVEYEPETLGLTRFMFLCYVDDVSSLPKLELALWKHPYTLYHGRFYGSKLGIVAQFNYPSNDISFLQAFFAELKAKHIIQDFIPFISTGTRKIVSMDLDRISLSNLEWKFDWSEWIKKKDSVAVNPLPKPRKSVFDSTRFVDYKILRILTAGRFPQDLGVDSKVKETAKLTQANISTFLNEEKTKIWRRIHFLEDNVITGYTAQINREFFNVSSNKLIFLTFKNDLELKKCFSLLTNEEIRPPFRYQIEVLEDQFGNKKMLLYVSLPQYHEAQLIYSLSKIANLQVFNIDTTGDNSVSYSFYEGNYDNVTNSWKLDMSYTVTEPLNETLEDLKTYQVD